MALNDIQPIAKKESGGAGPIAGIISGALGLIAVAAAPFTGGTSLSALPAIAGVGAGAAGLASKALGPGKVSQGVQVAQSELSDDPMKRRYSRGTYGY